MIIFFYDQFCHIRREALKTWKNNKGLEATYGNLLKLFIKAEHTQCIDVLCELLKQKGEH